MLRSPPHVLRRQPPDLRPRLRARLHVRRRPRPAHLRRRRLRPDRRARAPPRRAPVQPHHPQPAADRAGRDLLPGRAENPRDHRRGRGRRRRRLAEPARLAARRRPPRPRQAPDRAAHPRLQGPLPRDRRPPAPLRPPARHHRRGPRPRLRPRRARGFEPPRPPDRRLPRASSAPPPPTSPAARIPRTGQDLLDQRHACLLHRYPGAREFVWTLVTPDGPRRFEVTGPLESDDGDVLTAWALSGRGIILKPVFEIADHLASGELVPVAEDNPPLDIPLACLYPHKRLQDPKSRLFIDFMVAACKRELARILARLPTPA